MRPNQTHIHPPPRPQPQPQPQSRSPHPSDSTMRPPHRPPPPQSPSPRPPISTPRSNPQPPQPQPTFPDYPPYIPQPTFPDYPPYMPHPPPPHRRSSSSSCASCMLATAFLVIIAAICVAAIFVLFKPQDPKIAVDSLKFPSFTLSNNTLDFTIFQYVAVRNPNRYSFSHYDSSLQLFFSGDQLGFLFIPAGQIAPGRTQYVSATFNVKSIPVAANQLSSSAAPSTTTAAVGGAVVGPGPTMEVETRMKMAGRVRVFRVLAHHVETRLMCRVMIEVSSGTVLGFRC